jgi:trimethylguanosine synthase
MGKKLRQANVSGLSRFLQAFDESSSSQNANDTSMIAGPSAPQPKHESESEIVAIAGKRKTGLLGPGNEAYDATGLVPFYTDPSQVPAHLQKCAYNKQGMKRSELTRRRFRPTDAILLEIR